ncbi:MAG: sensor histidine kinase [Cyclobacteriaceae bacterium]
MQKYRHLVSISSLTGLLICTYLVYSETGEVVDVRYFYKELLFTLLAANLVGFALYFCGRHLNRKLPWKEAVTLRLLTGMISSLVLSTVIIAAILGLYASTFPKSVVSQDSFLVNYHELIFKIGLILFLTIVIYSLADFLWYSYNQYAKTQIESVRIKGEQLRLQFEALKSQLSPHYLFNCLNTISSLVHHDPKAAETFVRRLAETYQYVLSTNDMALIALHKEIKFVNAYSYLLKSRFVHGLQVEIDLPEEVMESRLPPLTLQMLVENAVKHNNISETSPLMVRISSKSNQSLSVTNSKKESGEVKESFRLGVENIQKRYSFFTPLPVRITDQEQFEVELPLIKEKDYMKAV